MLENHLEYLKKEPYSLSCDEKRKILTKYLSELTAYHRTHCREYARILAALGVTGDEFTNLEDLPFLPVQLFKEFELLSVHKEKISKTMMSSGTSGQKRSKVFLDKATTMAQTHCLTNIISSYIGKSRLPMLILDTELAKKDPRMFSARGAGIIGFSMFGRDVFFALNENMEFRLEDTKKWLDKHRDERIVLFGYTYMIWQYVYKELKKNGDYLDINSAKLFHIGGWKKLQAESVEPAEYNAALKEVFGNISVHNYYGMAEQLGSVYVECEEGNMHCSIFSDIIIRNPLDFSPANVGEEGLVELLSVLPSSYPGHIILTEDWGKILGEDDCPCGRKGKYFRLLGRIKKAELRGCSDTYGN